MFNHLTSCIQQKHFANIISSSRETNGLEVLESFTPETSQTITLCTNDVVDAANFQIIFGICHFIQIGLGNITRISQIIINVQIVYVLEI